MPKSLLVTFLIIIVISLSTLLGTIQFSRGDTSISVSIAPPSASTDIGEPVDFTSTVTGAISPHSYQWFLNETAFMGATSASWIFTPPTNGIYSIYLVVYLSADNSTGNVLQSETAKVVVGEQLLLGSFGYPNASSQASGSGTKYNTYGSRFLLNAEANITSISCLMEYQFNPSYPNQNYSYCFAIYNDNNGTVGSLVDQTVRGIITYVYHDVPLWYTISFPSVVHLAPAAYWLMEVHNASQFIMVCSSVQDMYESVSSFIDSMNFPASLPSPISTSNYVFSIYASWGINFSASISEEKNVFSVASNSTVTSLVYNSTANDLSFKVSGSSGTTGYSQVFISKTALPDDTDVNVVLDGNQINFTRGSLGNSWSLYFVYPHSTHNVAINMQSSVISEYPVPFLSVVLVITLAILLSTYLCKQDSRSCLGLGIKI